MAVMNFLSAAPRGYRKRFAVSDARHQPPFRLALLGSVACLLLTSCLMEGSARRIVYVDVEHAPGLGYHVGVVAFSPAEENTSEILSVIEGIRTFLTDDPSPADCQAELVQRVTQMLLESGVEVTSYENRGQADAVLAIDVTLCDVSRSRELAAGIMPRSETRANFLAMFEAADPRVDRVVVSRSIESNAARRVTGSRISEEYPDYPDASEVVNHALFDATEQIRRMMFQWTETRELPFFGGEQCGLDSASLAVESGHYDRALELSLAGAQSCLPNAAADITNAHAATARLNVAVLYRMRGELDAALAELDRAREFDPDNRAVADAIEEIHSAQAAAADVIRAEEQARAPRGSPPSP